MYGVRLSWRAVHIEDAELIARARTGDVAAYEGIVRRYQDVAVRTAHLVCPETDADDAVQEAFLKAYDALPAFATGRRSARGCCASSRTRRAIGVGRPVAPGLALRAAAAPAMATGPSPGSGRQS